MKTGGTIAGLFALVGCAGFLFAPAALGQISDDFAADTNLDTAMWTEQSTLLTALASVSSSPGSALVAPLLSFGTNGMQMSGVNGGFQFTGIQSLSTIAPPFTLTTTVTGLEGNGNEFDVYLVSSDLSQFLEVAGNGASQAVLVNSGPLLDSPGNLLCGNLSTGVSYTIRIEVGTNGSASVLLSDASRVILASQGGLRIGTGPFYVVLAQRNLTQAGPDSAVWESVVVTTDQPMLPPAPTLFTIGGVSYAEYQWTGFSCCATFDGIGPVMRNGSDLSLDVDLSFTECGALCVLPGFSATVVLGALAPGAYIWTTTSWGVPVSTNTFTVPTNSTPALQPVGFIGDDSFEIQLNGAINVAYVLQSSTDLVAWTSLSTNTTGGPFIDTPPLLPGWRFYRVQIPQTVAFGPYPPPPAE
jgi:hypothetical protein